MGDALPHRERKRAVPDEDGRRHARGRADDDDDDDNDDDDDDDDDGARSGFDAIDLMVSFLSIQNSPFFFFFFLKENLVKRKGVLGMLYTTDGNARRVSRVRELSVFLILYTDIC